MFPRSIGSSLSTRSSVASSASYHTPFEAQYQKALDTPKAAEWLLIYSLLPLLGRGTCRGELVLFLREMLGRSCFGDCRQVCLADRRSSWTAFQQYFIMVVPIL